jgi:hypothetical protein
MSLVQWQNATGSDKHSLVATPSQLFVNGSADDYHLKSGSPAIDAGTSQNAPTYDLGGGHRPVNAAYDIGAYEFGSSAVVERLSRNSTLSHLMYPNPLNAARLFRYLQTKKDLQAYDLAGNKVTMELMAHEGIYLIKGNATTPTQKVTIIR